MSMPQSGSATLAEPTYAVSYEGEARCLPAGTNFVLIDPFPAWADGCGISVFEPDGSALYWYVAPAAVRTAASRNQCQQCKDGRHCEDCDCCNVPVVGS